jgi:hypothetical protein
VSTLHITNGDSAAGTLRTFLKDPVVITADPLFDGPAPAVDDAAWYALRGRALSRDDMAAGNIAGALAAWDREVLDAITRGDDIVLWFEHDLFDQLLLVRTLDRIGSGQLRGTVSLICIDRFPGIERFVGLGQLTAPQLASLVTTSQLVSAAQFEHATRAWAAFRAPDPTGLAAMTGPGPLPFLGAALRRFLQEYPSTRDGLSRSANQTLRVLRDGPRSGGELFAGAQMLEESPFIGDWSFFDVVRALSRARTPLVTITPDPEGVDLRQHTVAITDAGRDVLSGRLDAVAVNGIDEWRGGVHLTGDRTSPWRWDEPRQTLISLGA